MTPPARLRRWRLLRRTHCWWPTRLGWLLLAVGALSLASTLLLGIYPFLAPNRPCDAGPVVVDGWAGEEAFRLAFVEHRRHGTPLLFVVGGPLGPEYEPTGLTNFADLGALHLQRLGLPRESIQPVPSGQVRKDRTYTSAVVLKQWLAAHGGIPPQVTLVSVGPHARRSRLLFQRAFGPGTAIGILAAREDDYDPARWWTYSQGFRVVVDEAIAYLYARLLFWKSET